MSLFQTHQGFFAGLAAAWAVTLAWSLQPSSAHASFALILPCVWTLAISRILYVQLKLGVLMREPSCMLDATLTTLPYAALLFGHALLSEAYRGLSAGGRGHAMRSWQDLSPSALRHAHRTAGRHTVSASGPAR